MNPLYQPLLDLLLQLQRPYTGGYLLYFLALLYLSLFFCMRPNFRNENLAFWAMGLMLVSFTLLRPIGLGIDDSGYVEISKQICAFFECFKPIQSSRDFVWYGLISLLRSLMAGPQAVLSLAAITVFLQLYIIHSLCKQKMLALTFFASHVYLLFDITIFRAGLALTAYFLAMYFLVKNRRILGVGLLASNFLFHSQGMFSLGLLPMHWVAKRKRVCLAIGFLCLVGIYLHLTPSLNQLSYIAKAEAADYVAKAFNGEFISDHAFPHFGLVLVLFLLISHLFNQKLLDNAPVNDYVLASAMLALMLSWFFAPITGIQLRLFDFYIAPVIFLAGNLKRNIWSFLLVAVSSTLLVGRLIFLRNFILG